jgi:ABC-type nitrate/sulfonate/bicarbonate transport system substrate-binding protein
MRQNTASSRRGRRVPSAVVLAAAIGLTAACGSGAAPTTPSGSSAPGNAPPAEQSAAPAGQARPAPTDKVKVALASDSAMYTPFFIAQEKGYFADEGLDLEMINLPGGPGTTALVAGEIDYGTSAGSAASAALKGAPIKVVYTNADRPGYDIWSTGPEVTTLADLVGKTLGIQSRSDTTDLAARMAFQQHGIDPNSVSYLAIGGGAQRMAAMQTASAAAVVLAVSDVVQLQEIGPRGRQLANLRNEVQMLYMGVVTTDKELQQHRDRAKRFLRASIKGREYFKAFKEDTLAIMAQYNGLPRAANEADYDDALRGMTPEASMPVEVQQRDAVIRAQVNEADQPPPAESMYDYSLVQEIYQELKASGWQPAR